MQTIENLPIHYNIAIRTYLVFVDRNMHGRTATPLYTGSKHNPNHSHNVVANCISSTHSILQEVQKTGTPAQHH